MKVVLISGKAQHGKDTFATFFKEKAESENKKVLIIKYGDILKFVAKEYFGWSGLKDQEGRSLLQRLGTDIARENNPNVWVECVKQIVTAFNNLYDYVLIPDTRFPNEIQAWQGFKFDYVTVRVSRINDNGTDYESSLTPEQKAHPSETALDSWSFDYTIRNRNANDLNNFALDLYEEMESF